MTRKVIAAPFVSPIHIRLTDPLAQPTAYEKKRRRKEALAVYRHVCMAIVETRLEGRADLTLDWAKLGAKYQALYEFTPEEIHAEK